jgi:hypothetical protein
MALLVVAVMLGGGLLLLLQGPLDVSRFAPAIAESVNREIAPLRFSMAGVELGPGDESGGFGIRLRDVRLHDETGTLVAKAPLAKLEVSPWALLTASFAPSSIELLRPAFRLVYTESSGLTLGAAAIEAEPRPVPQAGVPAGPATPAPDEPVDAPSNVVLAQRVAEALSSARRGEAASSYLQSIGLRDVRVLLVVDGVRSDWRLPKVDIALEHRQKRSAIRGEAVIQSGAQAFGVSFSAEESEKQQLVSLFLAVDGLVPRSLKPALPEFGAVALLGMPASGELRVDLSSSGELMAAEGTLDLGKGPLALGSAGVEPVVIDGGELRVRYDRAEGRFAILPSTFRTGDSKGTLAGFAVPRKAGGTLNLWDFSLSVTDAVLADQARRLGPLAIETWEARGAFVPQSGFLYLEDMHLAAAGGTVELADMRFSDALGVKGTGIITGIPTDAFKLLWPHVLAPNARAWALANINGGGVKRARFALALSPADLAAEAVAGEWAEEALTADLEASDIAITYAGRMPPLAAKSATLELRGSRLIARVPAGAVGLVDNRTVGLRDATFTIPNMLAGAPTGTARFKASTSVDGLLDVLDLEPIGYARQTGLKPGEVRGAVDGDFTITLPLINDLAFSDLTIAASGKLTELQSKGSFGPLAVQGGTVNVEMTEKLLDAKGDLIVNGVLSELQWVRLFGGKDEQQPPLRLSAKLDATDRDQLGLPVNHMVRGEVPTTLLISRDSDGASRYSVQADLTDAELVFDTLGWRKPGGQRALLEFALQPEDDGRTALEGFKVYGDAIAIDGTIWLDRDNQLSGFEFPRLALDPASSITLVGRRRDDGVLAVTAEGAQFDGKAFFKSLFSAGQLTSEPLPAPARGSLPLDVTARIGTVLGNGGQSLRDFTLTMRRRDGKLAALDARGTLSSGGGLTARLDGETGGVRRLVAETGDAGAAFKLVGVYDSIDGGQALLKVDLDGRGNAEKTGILGVTNFQLVSDEVVSQVLIRADEPKADAPKRYTRIKTPFAKMRMPFSVGYGQLVLHESYAKGPVISASIRGRADFANRTVDVSGTYTPLAGLNCFFSDLLPPLELLLSGRQGECLFGVPFKVSGAIRDPKVIVNPGGAILPGVFRQIMDFDAPSSKIENRAGASGGTAAAVSGSDTFSGAGGVAASIGEAIGPMTGDPAPAAPPLPERRSKKKKKSAAVTDEGWQTETRQ